MSGVDVVQEATPRIVAGHEHARARLCSEEVQERGGQPLAGHVANCQTQVALRQFEVIEIVAAHAARGTPIAVVVQAGNARPRGWECAVL